MIASICHQSALSQCSEYPIAISAEGFTCGGGTIPGEVCFINNNDWTEPVSNTCWQYTRLDVSCPASAFIVTDQGGFVNVDPPNPVTTTWRNDNFQLLSGQISTCISRRVQIPGVVLEYRLIKPNEPLGPNNPITTGTIAVDDYSAVVTNVASMFLSDAIAQGLLLNVANAAVTSQRISIDGTLIVDLPIYSFVGDDSAAGQGSRRSEIVMSPNARLEVQVGNSLSLFSTDVYSCTHPWDGIYLQGLDAQVLVNFAQVFDAITAFDLANGARILTARSVFEDNESVIKAADDGPNQSQVQIVGNARERNSFIRSSYYAIDLDNDVDFFNNSTCFLDNRRAVRVKDSGFIVSSNSFDKNESSLLALDDRLSGHVGSVSFSQFICIRFDFFARRKSILTISNSSFFGSRHAINYGSKPADYLLIEECPEITSDRTTIKATIDNSWGQIFDNGEINSKRAKL